MDNGQIYDLVNTILRKEKAGSAVSPERFTLMLITSMWEKVNFDFSLFETTQVITDSLKALKVPEETIAVSASGTFDLTTLAEDYLHPTTLTYTDTGARLRDIDIVTDAEWAEYTTNSLLSPDSSFPIAKVADDTLYFKPIASTSVEITYLKKPTEPFYDYYWDVNDDVIYIPEGASYNLIAGETYRDGTPGPTSGSGISVELPFPDHERIDIAWKILQKFGIPVQEAMATEYGVAREQKEESL